MNRCKHCKEILVQEKGNRKKDFCDNTCRSNFWYAKNKKGKSAKKRGRKSGQKASTELQDVQESTIFENSRQTTPKQKEAVKPVSFADWKEYTKTRTWEEMRFDIQASKLSPAQKAHLFEICKK